jgi:uncharacterized membrane protein
LPDEPAEISPERRARILRDALAEWCARGLLTREQARRLDATLPEGPRAPAPPPADVSPLEESRAQAKERRLGRGVTILINLGAIVLAAGLLVFFASNWVEFGRTAKIASLFLLTAGFYLAGIELTEGRWDFPALGLALVFLGCVMFGVDILLLALIYDVTARHAWALLLDTGIWLATAYVLRSRLVLVLGLLGLTAWFGAEVGYCWGGYWIYLGRPFHFLGLGALLLAAGGLHAWRGERRFAAAYAMVGLLLIYLSTLILSIFDVQRGFRAVEWQAPLSVWAMLYGPYLLTIVALVYLHLHWPRAVLTDPPVQAVAFLLILMVLLSIIAWMPGHREVWFILLLTLLTLGGIYLGIAWESAVFLNTSLVFFAINLYTRFYEYFWDAMPKSLFFILGGASLIAGGVWVERVRRRLLRQFAGGAA